MRTFSPGNLIAPAGQQYFHYLLFSFYLSLLKPFNFLAYEFLHGLSGKLVDEVVKLVLIVCSDLFERWMYDGF